ncbi:unnamed protein product [Caenorhabditis auriculariae]|uniref:Histone deacetylase n=1 Tax=Caenorhabditis auriculariae TaxID=2777116 RepID=A0A8S1HFB8_9PELO|nr:unnamed protein product [Caenorhabditis auriculariae]
MSNKKSVVYYFHPEVGNFHYGRHHPMKPQRLQALNNLIISYNIHKKMKVVELPRLGAEELMRFHSEDYVNFLQKVSPATFSTWESEMPKYNIGEDCPIFEGMFDYCSLYSGGSVEGARRLNHKLCDIVINWAGGLHHAKKSEASGFCYVNDIVLAILELLKYHKRVLYIDIDIHHGDGVQEAFNNTDRVMTVSFHRYGNFFPGTGSLYDLGFDKGKYFAVNVPFAEGIEDDSYLRTFKPVISAVMENYQPEAIVLQCGADSLCGDRLGSFSLSFQGHAECVAWVKKFNIPMLVVGGGGYTLRNVARCWTNETGVLLDYTVPNTIPETAEYYNYFAPDYILRPNVPKKFPNANSEEYLDKLRIEIIENLRQVKGAPSVQMCEIPGSAAQELESLTNDEIDDELRKVDAHLRELGEDPNGPQVYLPKRIR